MNDSAVLGYWLIIAGFLPYWFRFWQCINKYYNSGMKINLVNAGKYFSKLVVPFVLLFLDSNAKKVSDKQFPAYLFFQTFTTVYCAAWDYYMDWGLLRCWDKGKYGLREKISYPAWFYYMAVVNNFFLRFFWVILIFDIHFSSDSTYDKQLSNLQILTFAALIAEVTRRAQWALIRVENEFYNNFE